MRRWTLVAASILVVALLFLTDGLRVLRRSDSRDVSREPPKTLERVEVTPRGAVTTTGTAGNRSPPPQSDNATAVPSRIELVGPDGSPVGGLGFSVYEGGLSLGLPRSDAHGVFELETRPGRTYELVVERDRFVAPYRRFQGGDSVRLVLTRPVTISGTVGTAAGAPLSRCLVRARPVVPGDAPSAPAVTALTIGVRSDIHGRFTIRGCVPGQLYRVWANHSTGPVDVVAGSEVALVASPKWTVVLRRGATDNLLWWDVRLDVSIHPAVLHGRKSVDGIMPEGVDAIRVPVWAGKSIVAFRDRTAGQRKVAIELPEGGGELEVVDPGPGWASQDR